MKNTPDIRSKRSTHLRNKGIVYKKSEASVTG